MPRMSLQQIAQLKEENYLNEYLLDQLEEQHNSYKKAARNTINTLQERIDELEHTTKGIRVRLNLFKKHYALEREYTKELEEEIKN